MEVRETAGQNEKEKYLDALKQKKEERQKQMGEKRKKEGSERGGTERGKRENGVVRETERDRQRSEAGACIRSQKKEAGSNANARKQPASNTVSAYT